MTRLPALLLAAAFAAVPVLAMAQTAPATPAPNGSSEVNKRLNNQQQRINQGAAAGTLNQKQINHDTKVDNHVANQATKMEARDPNGQLTKNQTRKLNTELNQNSRTINRQKAKTPAPGAVTTQ